MNWIRSHRRSAWLIGITLLIPAYFYLKTFAGLLQLGFDYAGERGRIEPRVARLQGLLDHEAALAEQSALAQERLRDLVFPADEDPSSLAATLQADVRQIFVESGFSVSNSQVLPLRQGDDFDRIAVKLTVNGPLAALDAALIGVAAYTPRLVVESMDSFPARAPGRRQNGRKDNAPPQQTLSAVVQLMVLRELSP